MDLNELFASLGPAEGDPLVGKVKLLHTDLLEAANAQGFLLDMLPTNLLRMGFLLRNGSDDPAVRGWLAAALSGVEPTGDAGRAAAHFRGLIAGNHDNPLEISTRRIAAGMARASAAEEGEEWL